MTEIIQFPGPRQPLIRTPGGNAVKRVFGKRKDAAKTTEVHQKRVRNFATSSTVSLTEVADAAVMLSDHEAEEVAKHLDEIYRLSTNLQSLVDGFVGPSGGGGKGGNAA